MNLKGSQIDLILIISFSQKIAEPLSKAIVVAVCYSEVAKQFFRLRPYSYFGVTEHQVELLIDNTFSALNQRENSSFAKRNNHSAQAGRLEFANWRLTKSSY